MAITNLNISSRQNNFATTGTAILHGNAGSNMTHVITYTADDAHNAVRLRLQFPENANFSYDYKSPYSTQVDLQYSGNVDTELAPNRSNAKLGTIAHESLGGNNFRITVQDYPILPLSNGKDDDFTSEIYLGANSPKITFRLALLTSLNDNANPVIEIESANRSNPFANLPIGLIPDLPSSIDENITGANIDLLGNVGYLDENFNANPPTWYLDSIISDAYKTGAMTFVLKSDTPQTTTTGLGIRANRILSDTEYSSNNDLDTNFCRAYGDGFANGNINIGQEITNWQATKLPDNQTINVSVTFSDDFISCVENQSFTVYCEVGNVEVNESDSVRNNVHVKDFGELDTGEIYPTCGVVLSEIAAAGFGQKSFVFAKEKNDLELEYYSEVVGSVGDRFVAMCRLGVLSGYSFTGVTIAIVAYTNEIANEYIVLESRDFAGNETSFLNSKSETSTDQMVEISFDSDTLFLKYGFVLRYDEWIKLLGTENQDWYGKSVKMLIQPTISNDDTGAIFNVIKKSPEFQIYDFEQSQANANEPIITNVAILTTEVGTGINLNGNLSADKDTEIHAIFSGTNPSELGGVLESDLLAYIGADNENTNINQRNIDYSYKNGSGFVDVSALQILNPNQAQLTATISKDLALSGVCDFFVTRLDKNAIAPIITPVANLCCLNQGMFTFIDLCETATSPTACDAILALDPYERHLRTPQVTKTHPFHEIIYDTDEVTKTADRFWYKDECGSFFYDSLCCGGCNNGGLFTFIDDCAVAPANIPTIPPVVEIISFRDFDCGNAISQGGGSTGLEAIRMATSSATGLTYNINFNAFSVPDGLMVRVAGMNDIWFGYFSSTFGNNGDIISNSYQTFWNNRLDNPANFSQEFKDGYRAIYNVPESAVLAQPPNAAIPPPPLPGDPPGYIFQGNGTVSFVKTSAATSIEFYVFAPDGAKGTVWNLSVDCQP